MRAGVMRFLNRSLLRSSEFLETEFFDVVAGCSTSGALVVTADSLLDLRLNRGLFLVKRLDRTGLRGGLAASLAASMTSSASSSLWCQQNRVTLSFF